MKRSFLNLKSTFMWMVLGTTLFLGACNGTSTESENAGVGAEATQTDSEEATGMSPKPSRCNLCRSILTRPLRKIN